jgi:hypothetical protein
VVTLLVYERLAVLDKKGGYFNVQPTAPSAKRKRAAETDGGTDPAAGNTSTSVIAKQAKKKLDTRTNVSSLDTSTLFVEQDADDCRRPSEGTVSGNAFNFFDAAQESTPDPRSKDQGSAGKVAHKRAESISSEEGWDVLDFSKRGEAAKESEGSAIGYGARKTSSTPQRSSTGVLGIDQNRQTAQHMAQAPTPAQQTSRRRRSSAMTSEVCVSASAHRRLEEDFHLVAETYRNMPNIKADNERLKKRNAELTYLEFAVCQGDCDKELEDAHHRNWEKAQGNDALKARIRELEQQAEQDKNKRPLLQTE